MQKVVKQISDLVKERGYDRNPEFSERFFCLKRIALDNEDVGFLIQFYDLAKEVRIRDYLLDVLVLSQHKGLKEFYLKAFKRERYLDMKITALRGYAQYTSESEIEPLMQKFIEILIQRPEKTPYNYEEYEILRSNFSLPYLVKKYGYSCFKKAYEQVELQYKAMPDAFKGYFTLDEKGDIVELMDSTTIKRNMDEFFANQRVNQAIGALPDR